MYGHLDRFAPFIDDIVKMRQYAQESFSVNFFLKKDEIKVEFEVVYPPGFDKAWLFSHLAEDENVMTIME